MELELLLWRWSSTVQLSSLAIIAAFFAVLARSVRTAELRFWMLGWAANFGALVVTLVFWYLQPPEVFGPLVRVLYMGLKTAFVAFLLQGAWSLRRPGTWMVSPRVLGAGLFVYTAIAAFGIHTVDAVGVVQTATMGFLLAGGALALRRDAAKLGLSWLVIGFWLRSILSFVEAVAYGISLSPEENLPHLVRELNPSFLASHSSFDTGAEWFIVLGCVLALSERIQRELLRVNLHLLDAQDDLRKLVDRDPLTGLANRRSLPEIFRAVRREGATLLFFDLDDFKQVNDLHGHQAGDECLRGFASTLKECFRPADAIVRYAGDEFLVVARGLDEPSAEQRIRLVRDRLRRLATGGPRVSFSVGVALLPPEGDPDEALKRADESMYRVKEAREETSLSSTRLSSAL